jgi:hypothetical protein
MPKGWQPRRMSRFALDFSGFAIRPRGGRRMGGGEVPVSAGDVRQGGALTLAARGMGPRPGE